jgi:hypothetical protein
MDTARAANVSLEDFGDDMRRLMHLSLLQKITKKYLHQHMTMSKYEIARKAYGDKLRVIIEEDVPNHGPTAPTPPAAEPTPAPGETPVAVPTRDSSALAPEPDGDATDAGYKPSDVGRP